MPASSCADSFKRASTPDLRRPISSKIPPTVFPQENEGRDKAYRQFHSLDIWRYTDRTAGEHLKSPNTKFANIADLLAECREVAVMFIFSTATETIALPDRPLFAQLACLRG